MQNQSIDQPVLFDLRCVPALRDLEEVSVWQLACRFGRDFGVANLIVLPGDEQRVGFDVLQLLAHAVIQRAADGA